MKTTNLIHAKQEVEIITRNIKQLQSFLARHEEIDFEDCVFVDHGYKEWLLACLIMKTQPAMCPFCLYPFPITKQGPDSESNQNYYTDEDGNEILEDPMPPM